MYNLFLKMFHFALSATYRGKSLSCRWKLAIFFLFQAIITGYEYDVLNVGTKKRCFSFLLFFFLNVHDYPWILIILYFYIILPGFFYVSTELKSLWYIVIIDLFLKLFVMCLLSLFCLLIMEIIYIFFYVYILF